MGDYLTMQEHEFLSNDLRNDSEHDLLARKMLVPCPTNALENASKLIATKDATIVD